MNSKNFKLKGRGSSKKVNNKFAKNIIEPEIDIHSSETEELLDPIKTQYIMTHAKSLINTVESPDIGFEYSANPYQGCEHGCIYCYARNSHHYWDLDSGLSFETKILVKENAVKILCDELNHPKWKVRPIMLSGNTDCYQPLERKFELTRNILIKLLEFKHPVSIVTKNSLILRDLDILKPLASLNLVSVAISINGVDDEVRKKLEPRASHLDLRWKTARQLVENGIPTYILAAPMIPYINTHEIFDIVSMAKKCGVNDIYAMVVRLNGDLSGLFEEWLEQHFPDRKDKVLNGIKSLHHGNLNASVFGERMRGSGPLADIIMQQFKIGKQKVSFESKKFSHDCTLFVPPAGRQLELF
ncbi:MAG TPA: PA0069 family radical SAM protein [Saprospiraceae bacterium]|nr:PA0069 family radical SAM protein [Saprospiraceae bacterium]